MIKITENNKTQETLNFKNPIPVVNVSSENLQAELPVIAEIVSHENINAADFALSEMMGDAPACPTCGHITVRNGSCYKCLNCGESLGCS